MPFNANSPRAVILLSKDGSVHLCCDNYSTYHLSAEMLISFLSSPSVFLDNDIDKAYDSSDKINPTEVGLDKLAGVTLVTFSYSRNLTIIFPELLKHVFSLASGPRKGDKLNMRGFISQLDHSDAKGFLLRYFLDFSRDAEKGVVAQNVFNIDEESFYSIMREIFNASISFVPPKPAEKSIEQCLNEAMQQTTVEKTPDSYLISLPDYVRRNGLMYSKALSAVKGGKFKTVCKRGRTYQIDFREKPPKYLLQGKSAETSKQRTSEQSAVSQNEAYMPPEKVQQYISEHNLYSSLVARYITSKEELDFYVSNDYREVDWDGFRYLICDIDLSQKDEKGRTNEQRILEDGLSPVSINPETMEPEPIPLHHLGQREAVLVPIEHHVHSKYHSVFHTSEPIANLHTPAFEEIKKAFWKKFVSEYKKFGSFDKIPFVYPRKRT